MAPHPDWNAGVTQAPIPPHLRHEHPVSRCYATYTASETYDHHTSARDGYEEHLQRLQTNGLNPVGDPASLTIRYRNPHTGCDVALQYKDV